MISVYKQDVKTLKKIRTEVLKKFILKKNILQKYIQKAIEAFFH